MFLIGKHYKRHHMFDDLFNFGKQRTLKQSVGFYIFYLTIFAGVSTLLTVMGIH